MKKKLIFIKLSKYIVISLLFICIFINSSNIKASADIIQDNTAKFITLLYENCLGREPDKSGLDYWVNQVKENNVNATDLVIYFVSSQEFNYKNLSNEDFINSTYKAFFNRVPDTDGENYWTVELDHGRTKTNVIYSFSNSQEFVNLCNEYGIKKGSMQLTDPIDIYPKKTEFVYGYYMGFLGRKPDENGLRYYVTNLISGKANGASLAGIITSSTEFIYKNYSNTDYLKILYGTILNRTADSDGLNYWVNKLNLLEGREYVLSCFINSPEYIKLCSNYGITPGKLQFDNSKVIINTVYNTSLNDMINKQMAVGPALEAIFPGETTYQWRYAKTINGVKGYYTDPSSPSASWHASEETFNMILAKVTSNVDPLAMLNDPAGIYQLVKLCYIDSTTADQLNSMFNKDGVLSGMGQVFIDAAKANNVNPVYLAGHAIEETGNGTSTYAQGVVYNGVKVYNLFGIGAYNSNPDNAVKYAYDHGWTSVEKAIYGGADFISSSFIDRGQDTLYKMKWNPAAPGTYEYATDVNWAVNQAKIIKNAFSILSNYKIYIDLPRFQN